MALAVSPSPKFVRVPASRELELYAAGKLSESIGLGAALQNVWSDVAGYAIIPFGVDASRARDFLTGGVTQPSKVWGFLGNAKQAFGMRPNGCIIFEDLLAEPGDFDPSLASPRIKGQFVDGRYYVYFECLSDNEAEFGSAWKHMISEQFIIYRSGVSKFVVTDGASIKEAASTLTHFMVPIFDGESVAVFENRIS